MLVRPKEPFFSRAFGYDEMLTPADIFDDTHEHVRARPGAFEPLHSTYGVEQATAGPGERRNVRRG